MMLKELLNVNLEVPPTPADAPPVIAPNVEKEEMCVILAPCTIRAQTHPQSGIGPTFKMSNL